MKNTDRIEGRFYPFGARRLLHCNPGVLSRLRHHPWLSFVVASRLLNPASALRASFGIAMVLA